jgi:hypothetical protein
LQLAGRGAFKDLALLLFGWEAPASLNFRHQIILAFGVDLSARVYGQLIFGN